jgi:hypothetical protein
MVLGGEQLPCSTVEDGQLVRVALAMLDWNTQALHAVARVTLKDLQHLRAGRAPGVVKAEVFRALSEVGVDVPALQEMLVRFRAHRQRP